ncbi:MAG: glycosyltransferase family 4 protein [Pelatocladus maniniholoensis HA4357-MV3]|uniref:Glycosyltransferase family 4 protein n=1 Tax=Pelatocladus maniniholoensis HA4357-MV3 TaxID=1117104 RepID=A0A9E3H6J5_9NOST|nr:glycosyltransferase family 4 protein [Pelatocladus maniniholoensis HA4357-MV3]
MQIPIINRSKLKNITILLLYKIAQLLQQNKFQTSKAQLRKVVHISPQYFSNDSYIGGGERYPTALAQTMATYVNTVLISFGKTRQTIMQENLRLEVYRSIRTLPDFIFYMWELVTADIVHCHQYKTFITNLTILISALLGKQVFVTDHAGWMDNYTDSLPINKLVNGFLTVSDCSAKLLSLSDKVQTIYGGVAQHFVDVEINEERERKVLFVGRLMPHKGINYLIDAIDKNTPVEIIGRKYDEIYFSKLKELALDKQIKFITNAIDSEIIAAYRSATVTVLPSVDVDINGWKHAAPELLGLVLLESMACGTPVICTNVGGMPEIVVDKVTGFIVPPNDPKALKERIDYLIDNPNVAIKMGKKARQRVLEEFTWEAVVKRCLIAYNS